VNSADPPAPCKACPIYRYTENEDSYLFHRTRKSREGA
jgi:hypothetical protein